MTSLVIVYLLIGLLSYWPVIYYNVDMSALKESRWYQFILPWALWCIFWLYWSGVEAWYWWRAKK